MLTRIVQYSPLGPMLDNHCERPDAFINLDICPDHSSVFKGQCIVDVHVASKLKLWIPELDYGDFGVRHTGHSLHSIYSIISFVQELSGNVTYAQREQLPADMSSRGLYGVS